MHRMFFGIFVIFICKITVLIYICRFVDKFTEWKIWRNWRRANKSTNSIWHK